MKFGESQLRKLENEIRKDEKQNLDLEDLGILLCKKYGYEYTMKNPKLLPVIIMCGKDAISNLLHDQHNRVHAERDGKSCKVETPMTLLPKEIIKKYDLEFTKNCGMVNNKKLLQIVLKEGIRI